MLTPGTLSRVGRPYELLKIARSKATQTLRQKSPVRVSGGEGEKGRRGSNPPDLACRASAVPDDNSPVLTRGYLGYGGHFKWPQGFGQSVSHYGQNSFPSPLRAVFFGARIPSGPILSR